MKKILFITPISIAGALIINGLNEGFKSLGHDTLSYDVRDLNENEILNFNPDLVIGYDYAHFVEDQAENIIKQLNKPIIHYFGDAPLENYSHSGNLNLFDKLSTSDGIVFCWDKEYIKAFKNRAYSLPLAVNPSVYMTETHKKNDKIVFVGRPLTETRLEILCEVLKQYPDNLEIYSYEKHFEKSIEQIKKFNLLDENQINLYKKTFKGFLKTEKELANIYAQSAISLNITLDQGISSINYRVFEVLASKGFLITDYKKDTAIEFIADVEAVYYSNINELMEKIAFYLYNPEQRLKIEEQGHLKILNKHTFKHRAKEIIENISSI
ncbi:MAG: glycosyltransferase [bacterium]